MIDAIFYLNLDRRVDRRGSVEREIRKWVSACSPDLSPHVERMPATPEGALGCTRGHAKMLRRIADEGYSNALVLEDDFVWEVTIDNAQRAIEAFLNAHQDDFDVCQIAHVPVSFKRTEPEFLEGVPREWTRIYEAACAMGYLVNGTAAKALAEMYEAATAAFEKDGAFWEHCADLVWRPVQAQGRCYAFVPRLGRSLIDHSDLVGQVIDYG